VGVVSKNASSWNENYYVFGQSFLSSYVTVFDYSANKIGFAQSKVSSATIETISLRPGIVSMLIIIAVILVVSVVVFLIICQMKRSHRMMNVE